MTEEQRQYTIKMDCYSFLFIHLFIEIIIYSWIYTLQVPFLVVKFNRTEHEFEHAWIYMFIIRL